MNIAAFCGVFYFPNNQKESYMTRILQIRRGTTAQNNEFTGLPGELSFDTTSKTLRVHDGETMGGIEMALRSEVPNHSDDDKPFDINSVPDEFWQNIMETYTLPSIQQVVGDLKPVTNGSYIECDFDGIADPKFATASLVCQTPEAGYSIDSIVPAFGIGARSCPAPYTYTDENGTHVRLFVAGENFWVNHHVEGTAINITNSKWAVRFAVWY